MSTLTSVTLETLIEETLSNLYRIAERPLETTVGSNALSDTSDTTLTLADASAVSVTTKLEHGSELMLVTAKSADATPVFTVKRGLAATTKAAAPTGTTVIVEPTWARSDIARWIKRCYSSVFNRYLPAKETQAMSRVTGDQYILMPADTMRTLSVRHMSSVTGRIVDIGQWQDEFDMPTSLVSTGKALRLGSFVEDDDELVVTYQVPYEWSDDTEAATINTPIGSEDLAPLWVAAYALARREVSRSELDKIEEWNQEQAIRAGVNLRAVRDAWGEFYRRLDEVRSLHPVPRHRPYRKMPKGW